MSEKLFLIITGVVCSVATLGPVFFGMDGMISLVLCFIPLLMVPLLKLGKKN